MIRLNIGTRRYELFGEDEILARHAIQTNNICGCGAPLYMGSRFLHPDCIGIPCAHCGTYENPTTDHIIPRSKGGTDGPDNLQTLCLSCNSKKGVR